MDIPTVNLSLMMAQVACAWMIMESIISTITMMITASLYRTFLSVMHFNLSLVFWITLTAITNCNHEAMTIFQIVR